MTNLIGLVGIKQHGKDTVADILTDLYDFEKAAFADELKRLAMETFELTREQVYGDKERPDPRWRDADGKPITPRLILQHLGTEGFRALDPNYWVKSFFNKRYREGKRMVVCDVRFQNEVDSIQAKGGKIWVVDMKGKPDNTPFVTSLYDKIKGQGAYHSSETLARNLRSQARRGRLPSNMQYVPLVWGEPRLNKPVVQKAWNDLKS